MLFTSTKGVPLQAVPSTWDLHPWVHWKLRGFGELILPLALRWNNSEVCSQPSPRGAPPEPWVLLEVTYLLRYSVLAFFPSLLSFLCLTPRSWDGFLPKLPVRGSPSLGIPVQAGLPGRGAT